MLLQLAVCLPFISSFPVALDEPFSIYWSQQDMGVMLDELAKGNNAPLHFILLKGWTSVFGISPFGVRSLSLFFGVLSIYPLYKIAKLLMTKQWAVLVGGMFIFSKLAHFHFMEARMYGLFVMIFLFILYDLLLIWKKNKVVWWRLGLLNAALFATHYLGAVVIGFELLFLLIIIRGIGKSNLFKLVAAYLISLLLALPFIIDFFSRLGDFNANGTWVEIPAYADIPIVLFKFFNNPFGFIFLVGLVLVSFLITRNTSAIKEKKVNLLFFLYWSALPFTFFFYFSRLKQPIFLERYMLFIIPGILLLIVYWVFLQWERKKISWFSYALIIPLAAAVQFKPDNNREPDLAADYVKSLESENTAIAIFPMYYGLTFIYHYNPEWIGEGFYENLTAANISSIYSFEDILINSETEQLILLDSNGSEFYPGNTVMQDCLDWGRMKNQGTFAGGLNIYQFERNEN